MLKNGFSLIELMIVVGIIGILVAIALPSYRSYMRRTRYTEIIQAAAPYRLGVEECYQLTGELKDCDSGKYGIPTVAINTKSLIQSIQINSGVIAITPKNKYGITPSDNYILTPTVQHQQLAWARSGGAIEAGYAK